MKIKDVVGFAVDGKYDKVIMAIKELPPKAVCEFIDEIQNEKMDFIEDFLIHLSDEQLKEWNWLSSAKREREYILSILDEDITSQDLADLKSVDF